MLEDRDYMRQPDGYTSRVSFTIVLLIANALVFLAQLALARLSGNNDPVKGNELFQYFTLSLSGLQHGYLWQLLTYQFMHSGWMHIIFNSLAIYFFGGPVESALGGKRFIGIYLVSGVMGGLVQMLYALGLCTLHFQSPDSPVVGASAGAMGLVAAFAMINWTEPFTLILYFIPVTMRGRTLFWLSIALAVLGMLDVRSNVANAAHLGGILTGFFYARLVLQGHWPQWRLFPKRERPREVVATRGRENKFWRSSPVDDGTSTDQFLQSQVDPILEKISAHGIQSLTTREREILEAARKKMK